MTEHRTGTREEWLSARLELLSAEKELTRRGDQLAQMRQDLPWVRDGEGVLLLHGSGDRDARRPVRRPLAAARLPLHVRTGLHGGMPVLLGDRGRILRLSRASGQSRCRLHSGVASTSGKAAGLQGPHGLELPVGLLLRERFQPRLPCDALRRGMAGGRSRLQLRDFRLPPVRDEPVSDRDRQRRGHGSQDLQKRGTGDERVRCSRMASSSTPTPHTGAAWTASGACTHGSTAPRSDAMRTACGGAATTNTKEPDRCPLHLARRSAPCARASSGSSRRCSPPRRWRGSRRRIAWPGWTPGRGPPSARRAGSAVCG